MSVASSDSRLVARAGSLLLTVAASAGLLVPAARAAAQVESAAHPPVASRFDAVARDLRLSPLRNDTALGRREWEIRAWIEFSLGGRIDLLRLTGEAPEVGGQRVVYWEVPQRGTETAAEWDTVRMVEEEYRARVRRSHGCPAIRIVRDRALCEAMLRPGEDWREIAARLDSLDIRTLPLESELVPPVRRGFDGIGLVVEYRTRWEYRSYEYWTPRSDAPQPEVRKAAGIVKVVHAAGNRAARAGDGPGR